VVAEERNKEDMSFCEHFFNGFNVRFERDDIRRVQRLGRRNEESPRPVLVQFGSRHIKNLIMESLYKIKSMDTRFRNIIVAHDLTKKQREESKALVQEAKAKTDQESGDYIYKVRGPPALMRLHSYRQHCAQRKPAGFWFTQRPILRFFALQGRHVAPMG